MDPLKSECLSRMIFFGEKMPRTAIRQFLKHYHAERNHQGLDNQIIDPGDEVSRGAGEGSVSRATRAVCCDTTTETPDLTAV